MRRSDREIKDKEKIERIIDSCYCLRIGLWDGKEVYMVPLNFGYVIKNDTYRFYFHGAKEGRKVDILKKNNEVGFEMDTNYQLHEAKEACNFSAGYQSIIGTGIVSFVEDKEEKIAALKQIMLHVSGTKQWELKEEMLQAVNVFQLDVKKISCKEHL